MQSQPQLSTWVQPASAVGARHARATARKKRGCEAKENWRLRGSKQSTEGHEFEEGISDERGGEARVSSGTCSGRKEASRFQHNSLTLAETKGYFLPAGRTKALNARSCGVGATFRVSERNRKVACREGGRYGRPVRYTTRQVRHHHRAPHLC